MASSAKRWLPLEANPEVMNQVLSTDTPIAYYYLCHCSSSLFFFNAIGTVTTFNFNRESSSDFRVEYLCLLILLRINDIHILAYSYWVILQFLWGLGLGENEAECCDVYGLDEELLQMVPNPVLAVLFLYPITTQVFVIFFLFQLFIFHVWVTSHFLRILSNY